jgi:hypothetical protein
MKKLTLLVLTSVPIAIAWIRESLRLPMRLVMHFEETYRFAASIARDKFLWIYSSLALSVIVLTMLVLAIVRTLPTELLNIPNRAYWSLPARRQRLQAVLDGWAAGFVGLLVTLFFVVLEFVVSANVPDGAGDPLVMWILLSVFVSSAALMLLGLARLVKLPDEDAQETQPHEVSS